MTEKKRSEQALLQVVQEAFVNGVSTRKIERLAKSLGIESISASQVSEINKELNEQVAEFRQKRLESTYPVIWIDALYERIRVGRRVCNMAVHVVCKVHFMRNILAHVPAKEKEHFAARLKQIWQQPDVQSARAYAERLIQEYVAQFPKAVEVLENGLEDSLQYYEFPEVDARKISSTNILERLNKEIRRRSRVVGIFQSMDSYIRLVCCYLIEYSEDWESTRCYIQKNIIESILVKRLAA